MAIIPIPEVAKNILANREQASNTNLHPIVRGIYRDFVRIGEDILIEEARKIVWHKKFGWYFGDSSTQR